MNDEVTVEAENLGVRFGSFTAVDGVSFSVRRGETFGFLGSNGAGKTTTIRVLCGLLVPSSGCVRVAGRGFEDGGAAIKTRVGYMSQRFTLYSDLTVEENLAFIAGLRKMSAERRAERQAALFRFIGFDRSPRALVRDLPGGLKQELALAAALLHDPDIIFLDEPTAGVSPSSRLRFWSLIRDLSEAGKTVFVTTHYMDEAERCDRIALMRSGRIIALDSPAALKRAAFPDPLVEAEPLVPGAETALRALPAAVASAQPYGLRYHVDVHDQAAWARFAAEQSGRVRFGTVAPSLEDVFIRLVEGRER